MIQYSVRVPSFVWICAVFDAFSSSDEIHPPPSGKLRRIPKFRVLLVSSECFLSLRLRATGNET